MQTPQERYFTHFFKQKPQIKEQLQKICQETDSFASYITFAMVEENLHFTFDLPENTNEKKMHHIRSRETNDILLMAIRLIYFFRNDITSGIGLRSRGILFSFAALLAFRAVDYLKVAIRTLDNCDPTVIETKRDISEITHYIKDRNGIYQQSLTHAEISKKQCMSLYNYAETPSNKNLHRVLKDMTFSDEQINKTNLFIIKRWSSHILPINKHATAKIALEKLSAAREQETQPASLRP